MSCVSRGPTIVCCGYGTTLIVPLAMPQCDLEHTTKHWYAMSTFDVVCYIVAASFIVIFIGINVWDYRHYRKMK